MRFLFFILGFVLLFTWMGGFLVYHIAGGMFHLLLIIAMVFLVIHFFSMNKRNRADFKD